MNRLKFLCLAVGLASLFAAVPLAQASEKDDDAKGPSGLPLPRFASLRSDEVNLRTGPGTRYPIEWVFRKEGIPVEITAEFDVWRRIRDWEGSEGWVHKSTLSGKRTGLVTTLPHPVYKEPSETGGLAAMAQPGAIAQFLSCEKRWCKVRFNDIKGYMKKEDLWGIHDDETLR